MTSTRTLSPLFAALIVAAAFAAASADPAPQAKQFSATMVSHLGNDDSRTGDMTLTIDGSGGITGTYSGTGPKNDPYYNKTVPVTGSLNGSRIHLEIGKGGELHVDGTLDQNGIVGTGSVGGQQLYDFIGSQASG
ncbi:MAG: hypothetical protein JO347_05035 [Candidatus Eremiobacteraeota bacterium]|nr:hypothetical protein [Candidatus Eremiobacteraeota bacterium]